MKEKGKDNFIDRPAVVAVMGHIDHGKSALLDYIRKTNIVEAEVGGITQHLSAYEVIYKDKSRGIKKIIFLDTPGHEAFQKMRSRGATVADIAVLIVSAEEGVKAQTLEALFSIKEAGIPFIVAINKIDKPEANVERTKKALTENEIYLEGLGGDIPWVPISAKTGVGVPELLDMILLVAEIEELKGCLQNKAEGIVIEAHKDTKKGISATIIIKDGTLKTGMSIAAGNAFSPVRIMEDFLGKSIKEASFSSPVKVIGFNTVPSVGVEFHSFDSKKEAELAAKNYKENVGNEKSNEDGPVKESEEVIIIPIILKVDALGSLDALKHELKKLSNEKVYLKIVTEGVGDISESDIKGAGDKENTIALGFNVKVNARAQDLAERFGINIKTFDIIYKLSEWLGDEIVKRTPKVMVEEVTGRAKILKIFSKTKNKQVIGGKVSDGSITASGAVKILRRNEEIGKGTILSLQQHKAETKKVESGNEFGAQIESKVMIAEGDVLENFIVVNK